MDDSSHVKIMQSLGLDYNPAIDSTLKFGKTVTDLNKELAQFKANAIQTAKDINTVFSSHLGNMNNKQILDQWRTPIKTIRDEAKAAVLPVTELKNALSETSDTVENTGDKFASNATKFYAWVRAAKEATQVIKDVEMGMIEIQRVMTDSSFVFEDYRDELFQLGVDYGQTFDNVQSIALRWAQSGYNVADSLELTKTSLLALNTAELNATQATEAMIGIMSQWQLQAEDMALVMDKINRVADNNSVTSQDLVNGLLRSSSAAKNMNMSLEETIGLLTVMREASGRSGSEIGNALNSIISYMQRPKSIDVLESMGITMFADAAKTEFRNVMDIFKDIASQWNSSGEIFQDAFVKAADDTELFSEELAIALGMQEKYNLAKEEFNDLEKRDIAQSSAGVYRRNYFIGMIERLSDVQGVLNDMIDAEGYSMRENEKTMESLEKKQQSLKTSAEALAVAMGEAGLSDSLKLLADGGTNALNMLNSLPDGAKDAILAFTNVMLVVKTLDTGMKLFGTNMPVLNASVKVFTGGISNLTTNVMGLGTALKTTFIANAPLMGIAALTGAIFALYNQIKKWKEEQERTIEVFNQQKDIYSELNNLIPIYEELASKTSLTTDENEKLATTKQKIIDLLPESKKFIDDENIALQEQVKIVEDLNEAELQRLRIEAQKVINNNGATYERDKKRLEELNKLYEENLQLLKDLQLIEAKILSGDKDAYLSPEQMELLKALPLALKDLEDTIGPLTDKTTAHEAAVKVLKDAFNDLADGTEDNISSTGILTDIFTYTSTALSDMSTAAKKAFDDLKTLNQAIYDVKNGQALSADTILDLIEKYNLSADAIKQTTKGYTIEVSALENLRKAKIQTALDGIEAEKRQAEAVRDQVESRLINYGLEIEQLKNIAEVRSQLEKQAHRAGLHNLAYNGDYDSAYNEYFDNAMNDVNAAQSILSKIEEIEKRSKLLSGMLNDRNYGVSTSKAKKNEYKTEADRYAEINREIEANNALLSRNKILQDLAGNDLGIKIPLMQKQIMLEKEHQDLLHSKANIYRQELKELEKTLSSQGFKFAGEGDNRIITNLDNVKGKTKEVEEQFKRYMDLQSSLIPKVSQDWLNLKKSITDVGLSMEDAIQKTIKNLIELEKRTAYMDLEARQRIAQEQLDRAKSKMEREVSKIQGWIDELQAEIDDIQESERIRQESLERSRRLEEISKLQNKYYYLQHINLANISEEQAKLVGLEKEREQYLERQTKIQELQLKLENLKNQKTIKQFIEKEDGTWDYEHIVDQDEINNVNKQIEDLQKEHSKSLKDLKETTLENLKKAQEDYDEWERQNDVRRQIEAKQRRIKKYQDEIKDLQEKYSEQERLTNEAFNREKENLDRHYMDIDILTDEAMKRLHDTFGENWINIYTTLTGFFGQISSEYDALVRKLSTPLPTPTYSAGGQGFYIPSSGRTGFSDSLATVGNGFSANWSEMYMQARERGDYEMMELANRQANIERGLGDIITATTDINDIKKKYGFNAGGETQKTGWHWIDGEIGEPERILSAQQTKDFNKFITYVPDLLRNMQTTQSIMANIKVPSLNNNFINQSKQGQPNTPFAKTIHYHIGKLVFPDVKDAKEIEQAIIDLERISLQY